MMMGAQTWIERFAIHYGKPIIARVRQAIKKLEKGNFAKKSVGHTGI